MNAENSLVQGPQCTLCRRTPRSTSSRGCLGTILIAVALLAFSPGRAHAEFVSAPVTTAYVGVPYVYDAAASGSGRVMITAPNGLPPWLTLEQTGNGTATLRGTPGAGDTGAGIVLRSEDTTCRVFLILCYRYQFFDINIIENMPPRIAAEIPDQVAIESRPFSLDVRSAFEDPDGDPLTLTASGLPSGFTFSGGAISGTPTPRHVEGSPYDVRIAASDGRGGTTEAAFALRIEPLGRADLAVTSVTASPRPFIRQERATLTVVVENHGPDESGSVSVTIELAGQPFDLAEHSCAHEVFDGGERLVCPLDPLASGETASIALDGAVESIGDVYVVASVSPLGDRPIDPDRGNDRLSGALNVGGAVTAEPAQRLGSPVLALAAADLDGDGFDDVVTASSTGEPAALHLNVENPSTLHEALRAEDDARRGLASLPLSLGAEADNAAVAIADLDGDGSLDAAIADSASAVAIYFNDGSGVLTQGVSLGGTDAAARAVAAADIDGDGRADIVAATAGENVAYLSRPDGFEAVPLGGADRDSIAVAIADLDGDGLPEIVFANADGDASRQSSAASGFSTPASIATGPTVAVAAGDMNGDGVADLVFARMEPGPDGVPSNPVYLSDGVGGTTLAAELGASPTADVMLADVDGDGRLDIVAINTTGAHQVFVNDGQGGFELHPTLLVEPGAVTGAAGRLGMRETTDVVIAGESGVALYLNDGSGSFGLGDTGRPVIRLVGDNEISLVVEASYEDPGATVVDDVDGELTPAVDNPVDPKVIGTYVVTYTAVDSAGNAAVPATRTVRVEARNAQGGGGGGAADGALVALAAAAWLLTLLGGGRRRYKPRPTRSTRRPAAPC